MPLHPQSPLEGTQLEGKPPASRRRWNSVLTGFSLAVAAAISSPALAAVAFDTGGMVDIRATKYAVSGKVATPNDTLDDAPQIRKAIADVINSSSTNYGKTIYIPPGTWDIFSKIVATERAGSCGNHDGKGSIVIVGDTLSRPVLKLKGGVYNTPNNNTPDVMLEIRNPNRESCGFRSGLRGVEIQLGDNPGAVGLKLDLAQDSILEDVKVDATLAWKGIIAIPGRSMAAVNIEVVGGEIGMDLTNSSLGSVLAGVKLTGQRSIALQTNLWRGFSVTGLEIEMPNDVYPTATTAIRTTGPASNGYQGNLSLYDVSIKFASETGTTTAVANPDNRALSMVNVYTVNADVIASYGSGDTPFNATAATEHVLNFVRAPRGMNGLTGVYRIDQVDSVAGADPLPVMGATTDPIPANLRTKHIWPKTHAWNDPEAISVIPAGHSRTADARKKIQDIIDAPANVGKTFYLPSGTWVISGHITLRANTKFFGVPGLRSILKPTSAWPTGPSFMLLTDDNADATTTIQDILFDPPLTASAQVGGMHWMAGRYSVVRRVRIGQLAAHRETDKRDYQISSNGGGRWYSLADHMNVPDISPSSNPINCKYRKLLITGTNHATNQPVTFYGLNLERGGDKRKRVQYPFGELANAKNVRVFGQKMEIDGSNTKATNHACNSPTTDKRTDQPMDKGIAWDIHGTTENVFFASTISNDVESVPPLIRIAPLANSTYMQPIALAGLFAPDQGTPSTSRPMLLDEFDTANPATIQRNKWVGMFGRGTVNHEAFIHTP